MRRARPLPDGRGSATLANRAATEGSGLSLYYASLSRCNRILKDKQIAPGAVKVLEKMKPLRQVDVAELLGVVGSFSLPYVRAVYAATNRELFVASGESKKAFGLTPEQLAKMERGRGATAEVEVDRGVLRDRNAEPRACAVMPSVLAEQ